MFPRRSPLLIAIVLVLTLAACGQSQPPPTPTPTNTPTAIPTDIPTATPTQQTTITQWDKEPEMTIDPNKIYLATFKTEKGDIKIELFANKTPKTVNNLVSLAEKGFYDGTTFHRVLAAFMAQGGDPTGTGSGGPGYQFEDEIDPTLRFDDGGYLAMANSGPGTNGSQFFITLEPTPWLNGAHTIFGKVVEGMEVVKSLTLRDPGTNPSFTGDVLNTIEIEEISQSLLPPPTPTPVPTVPVPEEGRPLAELDVSARKDLYTSPPKMQIDETNTYLATIATTKGDITIELIPQDAPQSVNNFVVLANLGYWDRFPIIFVQPGEFLLTGSTDGRPESDVGYAVPSEVKRANTVGAVGYWFRQDYAGSSGSQFYILLVDNPRMDAQFTVFGQITEGLDVAQSLTAEDTIETITVEEQ